MTRFLREAGEGDAEAARRLLPLIYDELRALAGAAFRGQDADLTLRPTDLVHEAWIRLVGRDAEWKDRSHFFTVAAKAMRRVLIDHARARMAEKRGGAQKSLPLDAVAASFETRAKDLLRLHEALEALASRDPLKARLVELRFFGGLTLPDAAGILGVSRATAERDWAMARAWLHRSMVD